MQKVAAKELRAVNMPIEKTNPEYVQGRMIKRLQREIAVWSRLEHPHIVPLIGFRMEPRTCLISPWYSNGSVKDWVKDHPEDDGRKLMWQVANGLTYLHSRDPPIIHGDIKSDNILINNEGKAVINDFGLSQILEDISMESAKTSSTGFVGNVRWLAPEIFLDGVPRSMASDVYAFGCLVLEIATRALPFRGLQDIQVARALMSLTPPAADPAIYPELHESDALWGLMSTCWLHECTERPTMTWIEAQLQG
ncbi:hypothetical protein FRC02_009771 [Tulasnella sp. 418]|nr:hypothetical protein FRC02_009771 [Tulasnella sp. 418]